MQYHDHKVYALRHWDFVIDVYDLNDDTLELSASFSLDDLKPDFQHKSFVVVEDWICFITESHEACFISRFSGELQRRYQLNGISEPVICHSDSGGAILIRSRGVLFVLYSDGRLARVENPLEGRCEILSAILVHNQLYEYTRTADGKSVIYSTTLHASTTSDNAPSSPGAVVVSDDTQRSVPQAGPALRLDSADGGATALQDEHPWLRRDQQTVDKIYQE